MAIIEGVGGSLMPGFGPFRFAGVAVAQYNGIAEKGATYLDTTNGKIMVNTGTLAANTWTVAGAQV